MGKNSILLGEIDLNGGKLFLIYEKVDQNFGLFLISRTLSTGFSVLLRSGISFRQWMRKMLNLKKLENLKIKRNQRLKDEVHTSNDIEYLEIVARDKLNLQLPGEVIFRIQR